jgi:PAS domain S-box-containing protein
LDFVDPKESLGKMNIYRKLLSFKSTDPDDARRKNLLNTLLVGISLIALAGFILTVVMLIFKLAKPEDILLLLYSSAAFLFINGFIFLLNKRSGRSAAWLFLVIFNIILAASDVPEKVGNGSSMFVFAIPIATASLLLSPASSFIFATLSSAIVFILGFIGGFVPNIPTIVGFFVLALISWLSARGLEQALKELRTTNANLDRLVQERTQALAEALTRERAEAGRSKAILESIADGVIVFDMSGTATVFNPALLRLLELTADDVDHATVDDLANTEFLDARDKGILAGMLTGPSQSPTSYRIKWGKKTLSANSAQVFDSEGVCIGTVAVFRDFTREAEVERMKSTFLAMVSHELRTPLNAILGYAEMFKEAIYGPMNEKQVRMSERIMSNTRRLLDMISDILDQTQMEAGKMTIHYRPFRPVELIENVHGVMDKIAADKNLILISERDPDLPDWINGDPARLQQILINLINNAIKFTSKGSINFRTYRQDEKHWVLEVRDTGIGIPEEELPFIFDTFHQVDSTARREHGGFGLGLSIVKQLANLMSGEVNAFSKLGAGSTFTVTLPLIVPEESKQ